MSRIIGSIGVLAIPAFLVLLVLTYVFFPFTIVSPGERGVKVSFGKVTETPYDEGIHFILPIRDSMKKVNVQTQKFETKAFAASSDMQKVNTDVTVNYNVDPAGVVKFIQEIGYDYESKVVKPQVQESLKAAVALFEAEDLIQKRREVSALVRENLDSMLQKSHIIVTEISIEDFRFSNEFNNAIEAKVTAEQSALREQNVLEEIKYKAQQKEAEAEGLKQATILKAQADAEQVKLAAQAEAEAIEVKAKALAKNPQILQLIKLDIEQTKASKWGGVLPKNIYGSAPIPFLNVESVGSE
jgi:regulator of protease activity HflC (stomatin/prohibitin superfamily)